MNYYDVTTALAATFFGSGDFIFTAANDTHTLANGDVLILGLLVKDPTAASITAPAGWTQDAYFAWHDTTDGNYYAAGFYSKVWGSGDVQSTYTATWNAVPGASWCVIHADGAASIGVLDSSGQADNGSLVGGSYFLLVDTTVNLELDVAAGGPAYYSKSSWVKYLVGGGGVLYVGAIPRVSNFDTVTFWPGLTFSFDFGSSPSGFQGNVVALGNTASRPEGPSIRIAHNQRRSRALGVS